jgi:hypothetical protein
VTSLDVRREAQERLGLMRRSSSGAMRPRHSQATRRPRERLLDFDKRGLHADTSHFETSKFLIRLPIEFQDPDWFKHMGEIQNWNDPVESAMAMRQVGR